MQILQSICIDGVYYGVMFILYLTGVFIPSLLGICLMFGVGMALDFIPEMTLYICMLLQKAGGHIRVRSLFCVRNLAGFEGGGTSVSEWFA